MKADEPYVAIVATIRPHKQHWKKEMFEEPFASGTAHARALTVRALVHSFGKQELHGVLEPRVLSNNASSGASMKETSRSSNGVLTGRRGQRKKRLSNCRISALKERQNEGFAAVCRCSCFLGFVVDCHYRRTPPGLCPFVVSFPNLVAALLNKTNLGMRAAFTRSAKAQATLIQIFWQESYGTLAQAWNLLEYICWIS